MSFDEAWKIMLRVADEPVLKGYCLAARIARSISAAS
jgi:hypothetical protein